MRSTKSLEVAGVVLRPVATEGQDSPQGVSSRIVRVWDSPQGESRRSILSRALLPPEVAAVAAVALAAAAEADTDAAATVMGGATVVAVEVIEAEVRAAV